MIGHEVIELQAICTDCTWKGKRLVNENSVNADARQHEIVTQPTSHNVEIVSRKLNTDFPEISEENAKLIFVRKSATEAYANGEIKEATATILKTIVDTVLVDNMSKEQFALHLGNLERAKALFAAHIQGLAIGHAEEEEPKIKAKHSREKIEKVANKLSGTNKRVNELLILAQKAAMNAEVIPDSDDENAISTSTSPKKIVTKIKCDKCGKEVFSIKFHKC